MKNIAIYAGILVITCTWSSLRDVRATTPILLEQAAKDYRDAVIDFERHVIRARYFERTDRRVIESLKKQANVLRSATRRHQDLGRLEHEWRVTQSLHSQVEAAIFGRSCYPRNFHLEECWREVNFRLTILAQHLARVCPHSPFGAPGVGLYPSFGRSISVVTPSSRSPFATGSRGSHLDHHLGHGHPDLGRGSRHSSRTIPNLFAPQLSIPGPPGFPSSVSRLPLSNTRLPSSSLSFPSR